MHLKDIKAVSLVKTQHFLLSSVIVIISVIISILNPRFLAITNLKIGRAHV